MDARCTLETDSPFTCRPMCARTCTPLAPTTQSRCACVYIHIQIAARTHLGASACKYMCHLHQKHISVRLHYMHAPFSSKNTYPWAGAYVHAQIASRTHIDAQEDTRCSISIKNTSPCAGGYKVHTRTLRQAPARNRMASVSSSWHALAYSKAAEPIRGPLRRSIWKTVGGVASITWTGCTAC